MNNSNHEEFKTEEEWNTWWSNFFLTINEKHLTPDGLPCPKCDHMFAINDGTAELLGHVHRKHPFIPEPSTCGNCEFKHDDECRRYPPTVFYDSEIETTGTEFPFIQSKTWCGEHKLKTKDPKNE